MNRTSTTAWRNAATTTILAIAIVAGGLAALAGEVTVVGSLWRGSSATNMAEATDSPAPASPHGAVEPMPNVAPFLDPPIERTWYSRIDFLQWTSRDGGEDVDTDNGALYTLGYVRRFGPERIRAEIFGATMHHGDTTAEGESVNSAVDLFGFRGECEYLWRMTCEGVPPIVGFLGIGTRAWSRDVHDGETLSGGPWVGYQQTWWTIYPYLGLETTRPWSESAEFFATGRIGCTAITYMYMPQYGPSDDLPAFYPKPNITAQVECGWHRDHLSFSFYFDAMTWQQSSPEHLHGDPSDDQYYSASAQMFTTGLKLGFTY